MERPLTASLPTTPGVYLYKDAQGRIIYVGKARNLRKRVLSYFRGAHALTRKTVAMLEKAVSLETLSTGTEKEALLLEASLIKKHRPHYNIVLRDDKHYVLFRLARNEQFPRLEIVRRARKDRARYFGPFTSGVAARETWKAIHKAFPLRRCNNRAFANRSRPCLYYDLGQCLAPCAKDVSPQEYAALTQRVEMLLSGRSRELMHALNKQMHEASEDLAFERAAGLRDQLRAVERTVERQNVVLPDGGNMDVVGIVPANGGLGLGLLFVREGLLVDGRTFFWSGLGLEDIPELTWSFLGQFYSTAAGVPPHVIVPLTLKRPESLLKDQEAKTCPLPEAGTDDAENAHFQHTALEAMLTDLREAPVRVHEARNVAEARLVDMAASNAREAALRRQSEPLGERLARVLHVKEPVVRVECVDASHTGGQETRVGMVVFEDGHPFKDDYRVYAIANGGGDDYAALAEWAVRRAGDGPPWPDLLLIDGGRGQLGAVVRAFREAMEVEDLPFTTVGIAKARDEQGHADRRAGNVSDRLFLPGRSNPLPLRDGAPELLFLQHVRDTAHHFVIGRHRRAHAKQVLSAEILRVPGIGLAMAKKLWAHFESLDAMLCATAADLEAIPGIGKTTAHKLVQKFAELADARAIKAPRPL